MLYSGSWCSRAVRTGEMVELGVRPEAQSGKSSRKLDEVVGTTPAAGDDACYSVSVAKRLRHDASRRWEDIPTRPPLEALQSELEQSTEATAELARARAAEALPPFYTEHAVVQPVGPNEIIHPVSFIWTQWASRDWTALWAYGATSP